MQTIEVPVLSHIVGYIDNPLTNTPFSITARLPETGQVGGKINLLTDKGGIWKVREGCLMDPAECPARVREIECGTVNFRTTKGCSTGTREPGRVLCGKAPRELRESAMKPRSLRG